MLRSIQLALVWILLISACSEQADEAIATGDSAVLSGSESKELEDTAAIVVLEQVNTSDILRRVKSDVDYPLLAHLTAVEIKQWQQQQAQALGLPVLFSISNALPEFSFIPQGRFYLGDSAGYGEADEKPVLDVKIAKPFAISSTEITQQQWRACVDDKQCKAKAFKPALTDRPVPIADVSWQEIVNDYLPWLAQKTGLKLRLPSEPEWEYAARAGSNEDFYWGKKASHEFANYGALRCCNSRVFGKDQWLELAPVASFDPNALGLYDMHGNVAEWVAGCYQAYTMMKTDQACADDKRVSRGGGWYHTGEFLRVSNRSAYGFDQQLPYLGFRLLLELDTLTIKQLKASINKEQESSP